MFLKALYAPYKVGLIKIPPQAGRIMKLTAVILLSACLAASANGHSQNVTLTLKDAPLEKVFTEIRKQTGYDFVYKTDVLEHAKKVSVSVQNVSLQQVLDLCFKDQPLTYKIFQSFIAVKSKDDPTNAEESLPPPPIDVKGRVVNEKGEPVEGVTVTVKGTRNATATDINGAFQLKGVDENATLVISGVNIEPYEVKVNGKTDLAILNVKTKVTIGDDVTVKANTGYQELPQERATGSFSNVNKDQFENRVSTDVISRMEGITSGVVFNKQGLTGSLELSIRGRSTIFANDQPLIVVDNFPYDGDVSNINPNDIENIILLKDAAAASIWGVRASNGVIIITTKKGRLNQPLKLQLNTNITIGDKPNLFYNPNFLNSSDFIDIEKFLFDMGYYDADLNSSNFPPMSPVVEILARRRAGMITSQEADAQINVLKPLDVRNDLSRYLYRKNTNWQNALSISGGTDRIRYFFSAGYDKNMASAVNSDYDRITINTNNTFNLTKSLSLEVGVNYVQSTNNQNKGGIGITTGGINSKSIYPYARLSDDNGNPLSIVKDYRTSFVQSAEANGFLNWQYIPIDDIGMSMNKSSMFDTRINVGVKYDIIKGLSGEVKYQYQRFLTQGHNLARQQSYEARNLINQYATVNSSGVVTKLDNIPIGGILDLSNTDQRSNNIRGQLNFNRLWGKNRIDAIAGIEIRETLNNTNSNRLYGYNDDLSTYQIVEQPAFNFTLYPNGNSSIIPAGIDARGSTDRFRSYFTNIAYTFQDRYTFSASGRIDQSNFFGVKTNQRSVPLWSVGGKWSVSKEPFYNIKWLPKLALRTTYGYNGNLDRTVTAITTFSYFSSGAFLTGAKYASISNIGNPELRWEKTGILNIGIDFEFENNFLSGSVEYFHKSGVDLMGDAPLPPSSGISQLRGNFANMRGRGFDVQLNSNNINGIFKWQTSFLFSYANDKVTKYDTKFSPSTYFAANGNSFDKYPIIGYPVYSVFSHRWGGLDPLTGDPRGFNNGTLTNNYALLTGSPSLNDIIYHGPARPVYSGGLTNTLSYKGFIVSVNISYKLGYYFRRSSINYDDLFLRWQGNSDYPNRWQNPGDEIKTNVPSLIYPGNSNRDLFYNLSEILVEKGDHVRLQYVSASYDLSRNLIKKLPVSNIRVYFLLNNVGILWRANKHEIDPDFPAPSYGSSITGTPTPRAISFGLKTNF